MRQAIDPRLLQTVPPLLVDSNSEPAIIGGKFPMSAPIFSQLLPIVHRLKKTGVLQQLVGETLFMRFPPTIRYVPPNRPDALALKHQDGAGYHAHRKFVTAWIPLVAIDSACGGISLYPSMGHGGLAHGQPGEDGNPIIDVGSTEPVTFDMEPGDVLLFHPYMVHGSLPNTSDHTRISVDMRFFSSSEGLASKCLDLQRWKVVDAT